MRDRLAVVFVLIATASVSINNHIALMHFQEINTEVRGLAGSALDAAQNEFQRAEELAASKQESDVFAASMSSSNQALNDLINDQGEYIDELLELLDQNEIPVPPYDLELFQQNSQKDVINPASDT